jgi:EAL domain-containing protein (putative c-di-GMP-specific phosphodiesterase class I)
MDAALDRIALPAGTLLFVEGDAGSSAYLINSGAIEIYLLRDGREIILATRGPGEIVGEMAIIDSRPRSASARIVDDCELVVVTADQIAHRISETDSILRMCLGVVIARYREMVAMVDHGDRRQIGRDYPSTPPDEFKAALGMLSLESELRRAIQRNEFELFYQPIVRLPSRRLVGFEALLRWRHPTRGLIPPNDFIPIAEASGLIVEVTAWCLAEVGRTFPTIMRAALQNVEAIDPLFMSVNISGHDLALASFVDTVAAMLEKSGIAASSIKLEVTESVLMKDPRKAVAALDACRLLGLKIAIDDFGTGYSSLSYLGTLPITTIKIDRSFVHSMIEAPTSRKIIQMILRLAEELEIPVVAEGIELESEEAQLAKLGCAFAQGFLFGRPEPLEDTLALIGQWRMRDARASLEHFVEAPAKRA